MKRLSLLLALALVACGGDSTDEKKSTPQPGTVHVRFTNPTTSDVFVDATYEPYRFSQAGAVLPGAHDCTPQCSEDCQCYECGAPMDIVRRIVADGVWEIVWSGTWYELVKECGGGQCSCDRSRIAPSGSTLVEIQGGRARNPADGMQTSADPNVFVGSVDMSAGSCAGSATFELDALEKTVDVPLSCSN